MIVTKIYHVKFISASYANYVHTKKLNINRPDKSRKQF